MKIRVRLMMVVVSTFLCSVSSVIAITWTRVGRPLYAIDAYNIAGSSSIYNLDSQTWTQLSLPGPISGISGNTLVSNYGYGPAPAIGSHGYVYDGTT